MSAVDQNVALTQYRDHKLDISQLLEMRKTLNKKTDKLFATLQCGVQPSQVFEDLYAIHNATKARTNTKEPLYELDNYVLNAASGEYMTPRD